MGILIIIVVIIIIVEVILRGMAELTHEQKQDVNRIQVRWNLNKQAEKIRKLNMSRQSKNSSQK